MELFLAVIAASTGVGVLTSAVTASRVKQVVRWRMPTKVERILEQKELSRWLFKEVSEINVSENISKERIAEVLKNLEALYTASNLSFLSSRKINQCIESASTAMQVIDHIDQRYMYLLAKLVDSTVKGAARTSGEKEGPRQSFQTLESLSGIAPGFRSYISGTSDMTPVWDNKNNPENPNA